MSRETTVDAVIVDVQHAGTSHYGNPTYALHLDDGTVVKTQTDSGVGYEATNHRPRSGQPGTPVRLTLTRAGRVTGITPR